ncbi:MAG: hypothetical protein M3Y32_11960 [Pseudomonadota bacterium]|nr:hypothetical protein [Pseudomonadota bacterium]
MHLLVAHAASLSPGMLDAVGAASLPNLQRLLDILTAGEADHGDEMTLSPPHERSLARLWQWPLDDGLLPFAAHAASLDGIAPALHGAAGWGLLSPTYWHLGTERVALTDPLDLQLSEADSRRLFDAVTALFGDDGWQLHWGAATRWYAVHESLLTLPTASLDRVVGRNVDLWLGGHPVARPVRRLQAEMQMLLHRHPVNEARTATGLAPVNSVWLSGTGPFCNAADVPELQVDDSLRSAALAGDAGRWTAAWQRLDAGPLQALSAQAEGGVDVRLTLCGECRAQTWSTPLRGRLSRWVGKRASVLATLETL